MRKKKRQRSQRTSNYRSGFEATLAHQLKRGGVSFQYESIKLEYTKTATYTPDFILPNGIIIEAKGVWTVEDRKKHLLVREQHPHLDIRLVFMNASNKIRKGSDTTYAVWCEKKNIQYANKTIPKSWLSQPYTNHAISAEAPTDYQSTTTVAPTVSYAKITLEPDE